MKSMRKYVVVHMPNGKNIRVLVGASLSRAEAKEDAVLADAVRAATQQHINSGRPVSRYDVRERAVYWEYPDGTVEYKR